MNLTTRDYHPLPSLDGTELADISPEGPTVQENDRQNEQYDPAQTTRMLSIAGLFASWVLGVACVIVGSGAATKPTISAATSAFSNDTALDGPYHNWPQVELSPTAAELLPLLLSFVITMLIESMGLIHATTLRWALG